MSFFKTKLQAIDDGIGVLIPDVISQKFGLTENSKAIISEGSNCLHIKFHTPELQRQLEIAEKGMEKYSASLTDLAKK